MNRHAGDVAGHPAAVAVSRAVSIVRPVSGTRFWSASDVELAEFLAEISALESHLAALRLAAIAEADGRDVAARAGAASTQAWLRHTVNLTPVEAKKQTCLALALDRDLEVTRRALEKGAISAAHAQVIARTVEDLPGDVEPDVRERAEAQLAQWAAQFDPAQLTRLGKRILEVVDPEAADRDEARRLAEEERRARMRRELTFTDDGHGTVWIRGRLPVAEAAPLRRAVDVLAKPRPSDAGLPDNRTPGMRNADAVIELGRRFLATGGLPTQRGETAHLVVTIDWEKLRDQTTAATLDTGERLTPATVRRLACDAQVIPAVLGSDSAPLDLGRTTRLFTTAQRRALTIRDKGCAFPGCDRHPHWCEAHHIKHWIDGGASNIANGVLLCGHHHRVMHKGGWEIRIASDGQPEFIPPRLIDPERKPLRNHLRRHGTEMVRGRGPG